MKQKIKKMILHLGKRVASTFYLLIIRKMQSSAKMHVKKVIGFWSAKNYRFFVDFYCNTRKTKHPIFPNFYDVMTRITKNVKVCQINNIRFYNQWLLLNRIISSISEDMITFLSTKFLSKLLERRNIRSHSPIVLHPNTYWNNNIQ